MLSIVQIVRGLLDKEFTSPFFQGKVLRISHKHTVTQDDVDQGLVLVQIRDITKNEWTDFHVVKDDAQTFTIIGHQQQVTEPRAGMYFRLFHGRHDPDEKLEDWGLDGPVIGPCVSIHSTYAANVRLMDAEHNELWIEYAGDTLKFDSVYYGDYSIEVEKPNKALTVQQAISIQEAK